MAGRNHQVEYMMTDNNAGYSTNASMANRIQSSRYVKQKKANEKNSDWLFTSFESVEKKETTAISARQKQTFHENGSL